MGSCSLKLKTNLIKKNQKLKISYTSINFIQSTLTPLNHHLLQLTGLRGPVQKPWCSEYFRKILNKDKKSTSDREWRGNMCNKG